jgi:Family of unknown function (DUF5320)
MPRGDRTGPFGEGPMTGRAAGYCGGHAVAGFASRPTSQRYGPGLGIGRGPGRGPGAGGGFGYRHRFYATGIPLSAYSSSGSGPTLDRNEEVALLKSESERLQSVLETIERRLAQLETT